MVRRRRKRRHYQRGGILPFLIPLGIAAAKAIAAGAVSGAAGYGVKKGLDAATRKRRKLTPTQRAANRRVVANMRRRWPGLVAQ